LHYDADRIVDIDTIVLQVTFLNFQEFVQVEVIKKCMIRGEAFCWIDLNITVQFTTCFLLILLVARAAAQDSVKDTTFTVAAARHSRTGAIYCMVFVDYSPS